MKTDYGRGDDDLFALLARLHGHRCPLSILGARLGAAARARLGNVGERRLFARCFHETCELDGVQLTTGCTLGKRNIAVEPKEEHRLVLSVSETREAVEATLTPRALSLTRSYGEARRRVERLPEGDESRALRQRMNEILNELETAPEASLVRTRMLPP